MPVYFMSLFYLPRKVRLRLKKIQRDFLWGGGALEQRSHLVRWNLVCLERKKGGLGVRNLALMNKALLSKWNWRFAIESEALWKQVISNNYGVDEGDSVLGSVQREDEDKVVWTTSQSGAFSVKLLYSILEPRGFSLFSCGSIWKANVPPKLRKLSSGGMERLWGKPVKRLGK
ncbi:putative ribonuclease H protein [Vitis vinifera]|uniref:Putative ribonuclease H protein n=1 Tax=Vitis vinifera TaxID=29760 RepID=A0A438JH62_VITVI|nr:putative ribonuclease H protein [Vitis vinifera]